MKFKFIIAGIVFLYLICSCRKDLISTVDNPECQTAYESHPRDLEYQAIVDRYFDAGLPGLSVLINTPAEGTWEGSSGFAGIEEGIAMTPCHVQYAASIPKSFTAIAVLQQIEAGKLDLEDIISEYLDEDIRQYVPNCDRITIHQLLMHTSGIPECLDIEFITAFFNDPSQYYTLKECIAFLDGKDALWEPGIDFFYSDANVSIR